MQWTQEMLEATPQFCLRCESRITKIRPSRLVLHQKTVVQCGHCGYILCQWDTPSGVLHGNKARD